jgi:hypothetical protein
MKVIALAVAGFAALSAPAAAQYAPRPMAPVGLAPGDVFDMVRDMGLDPLGPPVRNGRVWIQRATDYYGQPLRVVVDADRAQVIALESIETGPAVYRGRYAARGGPYAYGPRSYPYVMPDDEDFAPPRRAMTMRGQPQAAVPPALPPPGLPPAGVSKQKSAAVTPGRLPVPRKRPASAPQETAGSVEPLPATPRAEPAPVTTGSTPRAPAASGKPASPAMTPVAPLE